MITQVVSYMQFYDEDGEPSYMGLVISYRLFGLLVYRKIVSEQAANRFGVKV